MPGRKRARSPTVSTDSSSDSSASDSSASSAKSSSSSNRLRPQRSAAQYKRAWEEFMEYIKRTGSYAANGRRAPKESEYWNYLSYLKKEKGYAPSSLWTTFSKLNNGHMSKFNERLQDRYPRLVQRLKNESKGHAMRKAKVFTRDQLVTYMTLQCTTFAEQQERALTSVAFYGGLRCAELREVNIEDITEVKSPEGVPQGLRVSFKRKKTEAEQADRSFLIPELPHQDSNCFSSSVRLHLNNLRSQQITSGPLARRALTEKKFSVAVFGKNTFYQLPKTIAKTLGLPTDLYSGHSLRRTSASIAADGGASTFDLRRHYGWRSEAMPQRYVDGSVTRENAMASFLSHAQYSQNNQAAVSTQVPHAAPAPSQVPATQTIRIDLNIHVSQSQTASQNA